MTETCCIIDKKTGKAACPLQDVEVKAVIDRTSAEVSITQNYINSGTNNIEAVYTFPMPHGAEVTGFKASLGGTEVRGEFREKEEAFRQYDAAVRKGDSAFLLESHRPDIFQISLGNLLPGEKAAIEISYIEDIKCVDNELGWVLPTVVAPRYIPGAGTGRGTDTGVSQPDDRVPDADFISPPIGNAHYALKLQAMIKGIKGIKKVSSPSHPVELSIGEETVTVTLARETELLDSDFILSVVLGEEEENSLAASNETDGGTLGLLRFVPGINPAGEDAKNYEYTFMIDVSGSMCGQKLDQAKRALAISLRNLTDGDFFNMVAFESNYFCYAKQPVPYSEENLESADKWIGALGPMGGTEIYEPMKYVLENRSGEQRLERVILLFTDGQVGNEKEIIRLLGNNSKALSFFPFGIDTAVNRYFIDSLAEAGNGMPEYVYPGERIEDKVIRQFSRIQQPYVSQVYIEGKAGEEVEVIPELPKRLYAYENYSFTICCRDRKTLEGINVCGTVGKEKFKLLVDASYTGDKRLLQLKWAKEKIRKLESMLGSGNPRRDAATGKEIIELSKGYNILSTLTSLVAVYKRTVKGTGIPETVVIPVSKPRGWDMYRAGTRACYSMAPAAAPLTVYEDASEVNCERNRLESFMLSKRSFAEPVSRKSEGRRPGRGDVSLFDELHETILKAAQGQKADGTFGSGETAVSRTACFIIGMLLLKDMYRPYRIQLKKAGEALLKAKKDNSLLKASALYLLSREGIITDNTQADMLMAAADENSRQCREAYDKLKTGDIGDLVYLTLGYRPGKKDNKSVAEAFLKTALV